MMKRLLPLSALVLLLAAGCAQTTLVQGSEPIAVASRSYTIVPGASWSRTDQEQQEFWTQNGPLLDRMVFYDPVEDGESLFPAKPGSEEDGPEFYDDMSLLEVGEFVEASLAFSGMQDVRTSQLSAANFGSKSGFRLEIEAYTESGLATKGFARGVIEDGTLYLLTFLAPTLHYHDAARPDAERMVDSIQFISSRGAAAAPGV